MGDTLKIGIPEGTPFLEVSMERNGTFVYDIETVKRLFIESGVDWNIVTEDAVMEFIIGWYMAIRDKQPNKVMEYMIMTSHDVN